MFSKGCRTLSSKQKLPRHSSQSEWASPCCKTPVESIYRLTPETTECCSSCYQKLHRSASVVPYRPSTKAMPQQPPCELPKPGRPLPPMKRPQLPVIVPKRKLRRWQKTALKYNRRSLWAEPKNLPQQKKVAVQNTIFSLKIPPLAGLCSKYRNNYFWKNNIIYTIPEYLWRLQYNCQLGHLYNIF